MSFILRIPRAKLGPLVQYVNDFKGSPHEAVLQINVNHGEVFSTFSSFEMTFGTLMNADNVKDREIQIDNKGWNGKGDLFIFIHLPLAELFQTTACTITLNVEYNAALAEMSTNHLTSLGSELLVFETEISNDLYFWPVANTNPQSQLQHNVIATDTTSHNRHGQVFADPKIFRSPESHLKVLFRVDLENQNDRKELESGAQVNARRVSVCTTELKCGAWKAHLISPFSIKESTMKIKISRKSGWIELSGELKLQENEPYINFHTFQHNGKNISWSLPRLNVDITPNIKSFDLQQTRLDSRKSQNDVFGTRGGIVDEK